MEYVGLSVAGPNSRALLQSLVADDLSTSAFPFASFRKMDVGMVPALVGRLSFTGELGYEIWVTSEYQRALYELLLGAGREYGLKLFGGRALHSLRLEKGFGTWAREFRPIYGPHEAGLARFVDLKKADFIGKVAVLEEQQSGGALRLSAFAVDAADTDAIGRHRLELRRLPPERAGTSRIELDQVVAQSGQECSVAPVRRRGKSQLQSRGTLDHCGI